MDSLSLVKLIAPVLLFLMTLGMGMTLVWDDVRNVVRYPKAVTIGAINQAVTLPLVGFGLVIAFAVPPEIAVGVMLLTLCPGGVGSNITTLLAKGDVALSVSLTLISGALIIFTLPILMNFSLSYFMGTALTESLPVGETALRLIILVLVPVAVGMIIRHRAPVFATRAERWVKLSGFALLSLLIVGVLVKEFKTFVEYSEIAGGIVTALCFSTMAIGYFSALLFGLDARQCRTICIEVGIQNTTLALLIAGLLNMPALTIPAVIYVVVNSLVLVGIILWANLPLRANRQAGTAPPGSGQ
mgnify:CR=1 FL=1